MRVAEIMSHKVHTVNQHENISRVMYLMNYEKIRHLPVVEKGRIVGIVSDRDLYKALGTREHTLEVESEEQLHSSNRVQNIMRRGVVTTTPEASVSEAADLMAGHKIGALPVVVDNKLVGIVSAVDILKLMAKQA